MRSRIGRMYNKGFFYKNFKILELFVRVRVYSITILNKRHLYEQFKTFNNENIQILKTHCVWQYL